jgi:hypothetical protein
VQQAGIVGEVIGLLDKASAPAGCAIPFTRIRPFAVVHGEVRNLGRRLDP